MNSSVNSVASWFRALGNSFIAPGPPSPSSTGRESWRAELLELAFIILIVFEIVVSLVSTS